jgi:hypothetical protein
LQTLLEDPENPGQIALPKGFDLQEFARQVEAEQQAKAKRKRGLFGQSKSAAVAAAAAAAAALGQTCLADGERCCLALRDYCRRQHLCRKRFQYAVGAAAAAAAAPVVAGTLVKYPGPALQTHATAESCTRIDAGRLLVCAAVRRPVQAVCVILFLMWPPCVSVNLAGQHHGM